MRAALMVVVVGCLGCGVDGQMMAFEEPDGGSTAPDASSVKMDAPPASPTPDASVSPDRQPSPDTRAPDTMPAPSYSECGATAGATETACGFLLPGMCGGYGWAPKFKDGYECVVCTSPTRTACLEKNRGPDECDKPLPTGLCVQGCSECCFKTKNAPCASDADCCAPLHCQSGSGSGKSCQ